MFGVTDICRWPSDAYPLDVRHTQAGRESPPRPLGLRAFRHLIRQLLLGYGSHGLQKSRSGSTACASHVDLATGRCTDGEKSKNDLQASYKPENVTIQSKKPRGT